MIERLIAWFRSLFTMRKEEEAKPEEVSQTRIGGERNNHVAGGQLDTTKYVLRHKSGIEFCGTPAEFAAYAAKLEGTTPVQVARRSIVVQLLKYPEGERSGWRLLRYTQQ
jgi:hypothetical protein